MNELLRGLPPLRFSAGVQRLGKRLAILVLRHAPLSWKLKRTLIWYASPRYAVGVHAVLRNGEGRVLLLRSSYSRQWQLPGGGVKYGEALDQALHREVCEETRLTLASAELVVLLDDVSGRGLHAVYRGEVADAEPWPVRLSEEHTAWRLVDPAELRGFYRRAVDEALAAGDRAIRQAAAAVEPPAPAESQRIV